MNTFPPYKAAVDAGAGSVMASFNEVDGIPATANKWLMTDVLRKQWGFKGFVVTDYTGINEMIDHGIGDLQTVSAKALMAGIDMDMVGEGILLTTQKSLKEGKVTMAQLMQPAEEFWKQNISLVCLMIRINIVMRTGLKPKYLLTAQQSSKQEIAAQSFVLLKNQGNVLPLKKAGTVALIGPLADNKENMPGTWSVAANFSKATSVLTGLQEVVGNKVKILHARGSNLDSDSLFEERAGMFGKSLRRDSRPADVILKEALDIANQADVIVAALGESSEMSGESSSRSDIEIPQLQQDLLNALLKTGKPVVLVLFTGRPLALK